MTALLVIGPQTCSARCWNATGPDCDCICDGRLHGVGWDRAVELAPELVAADQPGAVVALGLPLRDVDWDAGLTDDELRAALKPEELAPLLVDAAATVDREAREAERLGRGDDAAALDRLRDELVAEALDAGPAPAKPAIECAGPEERRVAPGPLQVAEERPAPRTDVPVDLRAPYSAGEWMGVQAALKAERERRSRLGLPFPQAEQVAVIHEAVRPMRQAALLEAP